MARGGAQFYTSAAMLLPITRDSVTLEPVEPSTRDSVPLDARTDEAEVRYRTHRRFDRAARLFSEPGLHRLMAAKVAVVGVGGVGSFAAESLVRSGLGLVRLVDFDRVCVTNTNRQLHAMQGTIGRPKVDVMAERLRLIHPTGKVEALPIFYQANVCDEVLEGDLDYVVDAIDNLSAKAHLIATCQKRGIPVVSSMGAAGRMDPTQIRVADLADTYKDAFAAALRKILRSEYELSIEKGKPTGVTAVFSPEDVILPKPPAYDEGEGFRCVCPGGKNGLHDCDRRARIDGSASFVTGAFGLALASVVVRELISS